MKALLSIFLISHLISISLGDCEACKSVRFHSEDGLADEYSRYMGTWIQQSVLYNNKPMYHCIDCMGLDNLMIYENDAWRIVDCLPNDTTACGGSHSLIYSSYAPQNSCPEDNIAPWFYCDGEIVVGSGCTNYKSDFTAAFSCVS